MERVYNFSAGPSMLPESVLVKAQKELVQYGNSGMSVMEMSHRSSHFEEIIDATEKLLREVMKIPDNYKVLFLQGGASSQFSMIPMNLLTKSKKADYVVTGEFAKKAYKEALRYGTINKVASSEDAGFNYIPELDPAKFDKDADYFYITTNNTIYGTRFTELPDTGNVPLVADMSSNILAEAYDISKFGLIYAGAQKNMGPAGLTVVIIREDLISDTLEMTPTMFSYKTHADAGSMYNTPPTYSIYICKLVLEWLKDLGGISEMEKINIEKAQILYDYLDASAMFKGTTVQKDRSIMNIPFVCPSEELNAKFIKEAAANGFVNLKGHRSVGGMRASIYNAMPTEGLSKLVEFMKKFEIENR
ncbi:3-phosphoserine/phosphohydroxythreonine transaminase [Petroclostridium sp. X23]|uniref:3-phosphoserine/phosphohydroxythreonine transaminase n=1 Tax=Petroclostridium sp. X23 TaxID=3045146 RepID=UPI0024ADDE23|nr:3-phosphoserine/phosphohydroxythreonine transaminase [Petroclostridium sp. X23]WHH59682.1 3-phosphoserine/phosphohydroxythreonine transaminase [Petroclostridium sp. X23]